MCFLHISSQWGLSLLAIYNGGSAAVPMGSRAGGSQAQTCRVICNIYISTFIMTVENDCGKKKDGQYFRILPTDDNVFIVVQFARSHFSS